MGEISEALRRARHEGTGGRELESRLPRGRNAGGAGSPRFGGDIQSAGETHQIPRDRSPLWVARAVLVEPEGPVAERFRHLAIRLRDELERRESPILLVTSAGRGEGKTTTACNLALALTSIAGGRRVALLDFDLRRPSIARTLQVENPPGLERALAGELPSALARVPTDTAELDVYPVRDARPRAHEILAGPSVGTVLRDMAQRYAAVVCDMPPVLPVPDVPLLVGNSAGCLVVARAGLTRSSPFRETLSLLPPEKVLGVFLNGTPVPRKDRYYSYYGAGDE